MMASSVARARLRVLLGPDVEFDHVTVRNRVILDLVLPQAAEGGSACSVG